MKNKGFTLIELLAVIVILAIIALIVTPMISNVIVNAKKASASRSVEGTVTAIEYAKQVSILDMSALNSDYKLDEEYSVDISTIDFKAGGNKPTAGYVNIVKGKVISGVFCIDNYLVEYTRGTTKILSEAGCDTTVNYVVQDSYNPSGPFTESYYTEYNPSWFIYSKNTYLSDKKVSDELCINTNGKNVCANENNRINKDNLIKASDNGIFETSLCSDLTPSQKNNLSSGGVYSVDGFKCAYGNDSFIYSYKKSIISDNEHFTPKRSVSMRADHLYTAQNKHIGCTNETIYYSDSDFREDMLKYLEMPEDEFNALPGSERDDVGSYFNVNNPRALLAVSDKDGNTRMTTALAVRLSRINEGRLVGYASMGTCGEIIDF